MQLIVARLPNRDPKGRGRKARTTVDASCVESRPVLTVGARQRVASELQLRSIAGRRPAIRLRQIEPLVVRPRVAHVAPKAWGGASAAARPLLAATTHDGWGRRAAPCPACSVSQR